MLFLLLVLASLSAIRRARAAVGASPMAAHLSDAPARGTFINFRILPLKVAAMHTNHDRRAAVEPSQTLCTVSQGTEHSALNPLEIIIVFSMRDFVVRWIVEW